MIQQTQTQHTSLKHHMEHVRTHKKEKKQEKRTPQQKERTMIARELGRIGIMSLVVQEDYDKSETTNTNTRHIVEAPYRTCHKNNKRRRKRKKNTATEMKRQ